MMQQINTPHGWSTTSFGGAPDTSRMVTSLVVAVAILIGIGWLLLRAGPG